MIEKEQEDFINFYKVPCETIYKLSVYRERLVEWNQKFNLIAPSTIPHIWTRHFLDSAQLMPFIPESAHIAADMGSGAGFPGLVLGVMAQGLKKPLQIHVIESTGKKADFLQAVTDELELNIVVRRERIEAIRDLKADIVMARALKPLPDLLGYANHLAYKGTRCLFLKGRNISEELTRAQKQWIFQSEIFPSRSDDSGRIIVLSDIRYKSRR